MEILAKILGGHARVKIMRLFLLNIDTVFEIEEISSRSRVTKSNTRKEINTFSSIGFIKSKSITREGSRGAKKKISVWHLNQDFQYLKAIKDLLVDPSLLMQEDLIARFKQIGKMKLMIVSGVFIGDEKSRADLMIVGDKIKRTTLNQIIKGLEAEIGKELNYVLLNTEEFKYRLDMHDKLVCDIIDLPHLKLVDNGQLSTYISKK